MAAWSLAEPFKRPIPQPLMWNHVGAHRNADPQYVFPNKRVVKHSVADSPFRTSSMRGLGAYGNVFAIEPFMDELAHAADADAGQIVNPDGLSNQLEGGLIQSASWTLKEQVQFNRAGVTCPILHFAEGPVVETI